MRGFVRLLRCVLALVLVIYALGFVVLQVLWRTPALALWWVQLLNLFGLWLYLPLPFGLLLAPLVWPRRAALVLILPLLCFGWEYGGLFVPQPIPAGGTPLRVMTWNILVRNYDTDSIVRTVQAQHPDIVAIQELGELQATALDAALARDYPHKALSPGGSDGLGVWSRYPIVEWSASEGRRTGCSCQHLLLDVEGRRVRLVNAHPTVPQYRWGYRYLPVRNRPIRYPRYFSTEPQEPVLAALVSEARIGGDPLIMVGDFNTGDRQPNYWRLRQYLGDAYREAGSGFGLTFPNAGLGVRSLRLPAMIRIDYIFHSPGIVARHAYTVAAPTSDHRAVVADLALTAASPSQATAASNFQATADPR